MLSRAVLLLGLLVLTHLDARCSNVTTMWSQFVPKATQGTPVDLYMHDRWAITSGASAAAPDGTMHGHVTGYAMTGIFGITPLTAVVSQDCNSISWSNQVVWRRSAAPLPPPYTPPPPPPPPPPPNALVQVLLLRIPAVISSSDPPCSP